MLKTQLIKLNIKKFRALNDVAIELGTHVTVICGKNGTSKSSILGIAAQIFSFEKDYTKEALLTYQTISGAEFKSKYKDHFRLSNQFDTPGSMEVDVELLDGFSNKKATAELGLSKRGKTSRPVVRKNSTATKGKESRNFTHPVIFLSLKRLYPIANRNYKKSDFDYLDKNKQKFIKLTNELLNRTSSAATSTTGMIDSAVAHGENYDQDSVSAGEDNAGQIMLALMSFRKLKEEYSDYKGGLLLIDEADAGLFPAAQLKLVEILNRECNELSLQVVMTSHSPTLIGYTFEQSQLFQRRFKTVYLSDTYGSVQAMHDKSWPEIEADLHTKTIPLSAEVSLPKINVYLEDKEACDLFNAAMYLQPALNFLRLLDVSLSCGAYIDLVRRDIPEFSSKSIVCLDADVDALKIKDLPSIVLLPGSLPPDQLIFEYLYNLKPSHPIWKNKQGFTRPVFTKIISPLINRLSIPSRPINLENLIIACRIEGKQEKQKLRELFKNAYKNSAFKEFLEQEEAEHNPWRCWARENKSHCEKFIERFISQLSSSLHEAHHVDKSKLAFLNASPSAGKSAAT